MYSAPSYALLLAAFDVLAQVTCNRSFEDGLYTLGTITVAGDFSEWAAIRADGDNVTCDGGTPIGEYVEAAVGGDPLVGANGIGDGFAPAGTSVNFPPPGSPDYSFAPVGSTSGLGMEFRVPWADISVIPNPALTFHVGSTNSQPGAASFPSKVDENMAGCGGPGFVGNAAVTFDPSRTISYIAGSIEYAAHTITKDGSGDDTFNLSSSASGAFSPTISYYNDADASGTFTVGDTLLTDTDGDLAPGTGVLASGATLNVLVAYAIPASVSGVVTITNTATSERQPLVSDSETDVLGGPPFFDFQAGTGEAVGTHSVVLVLTFPGGGTAVNDVIVEITDLMTGSAHSSTDYTAIGTTTFPAGSNDGATLLLPIPIFQDTLALYLIVGNQSIS
jgi:hypothetical protein